MQKPLHRRTIHITADRGYADIHFQEDDTIEFSKLELDVLSGARTLRWLQEIQPHLDALMECLLRIRAEERAARKAEGWRPWSDRRVWANVRSGIYYFSGDPNFGRTKDGVFMRARDAEQAGFRPRQRVRRRLRVIQGGKAA